MPNLQLPSDWAEWKKAALEITGHFEDSTNPFGAVTGDFDGMGISLGVLQWNIGKGSLQPLVTGVGRAGVIQMMPTFGHELWSACTSTIRAGLQIVRSWQSGSTIRNEVRAELKAFTRSAAFVEQQVQAADETARSAYATAKDWAAASRTSFDKALFCWFFDLTTQNGGLKTITAASVAQYIDLHGSERVDDAICEWLASCTGAYAGYRDAQKNAELWRNAVPDSRLVLFATSYLRSGLSRVVYRADVLNRKGTIALGTGWVHAERHNLKGLLGLP